MKSYRNWCFEEFKKRTEPFREGFRQDGWYFWENKDQRIPVKARKYLGIENERAYMLVHGSNTGIPLDECVPLSENMWSALDKKLPGRELLENYLK